MKLVLLALILVGCRSGRDSLADGAPIPEGMGLVAGKFDFSKVNWEVNMGVRQVGFHEVLLGPTTDVFAIPLPPGRYKINFIYAYSPEPDDLHIEVVAGEATYIGSWYAVLGMNVDLKDERAALAPEFERRWGLTSLRSGLPGAPRIVIFEVNPLLADWPGWDFIGGDN